MIYKQLHDHLAGGETVRAAVIGPGRFATAIVTQSSLMPHLDVVVAADVDLAHARNAFRRAGHSDEDIIECSSRQAALAALEQGHRVIMQDGMLVMDLPIDVIAEATGVPEAGARHAEAAIRHGKHVAMVNKEADALVGPILKHMADRAAVVYSAVDGDQHGLLIEMVEWARSLGLEVLCGGKSRDQEFIYDAAACTVSCEHQSVTIGRDDASLLHPLKAGQAVHVIPARTALLQSLPQVAAFDLTEMALAANATGLAPHAAGRYCPPLYTSEIPSVFCPAKEGGVLSTSGVVNTVITLRGPHEVGLGGGVFIVVACHNEYSRDILMTRGISVNSSSTAGLLFRPYHLCGVEAPMTLVIAGLLRLPTGASDFRPRVDLFGRAVKDLPAGHSLKYDDDATVRVTMSKAQPVSAGQPLPILLAHGEALTVDVPAGASITPEMVVPPAGSRLWALRAEQDKLFLMQPR